MKKIIYVICLLISLSGCSKENDNDSYGKDSIVLNLKPNDLSDETRATEPGNSVLNENKINNLHVFFFKNGATNSDNIISYESYSSLVFNNLSIFAQELSTSRQLFDRDVVYDIYTVVNLPSNVIISSPITLGTIKSLHTLTPINSNSLQTNFVMDGKVSAILNPSIQTPVLNIEMPLKRAASKIRIKFVLSPDAAVSSASVVQVSLRNFAKSSSLIDGNPYSLTSSDYDNSSYITATPLSTFTLYCYENNWATTVERETYLMVNIPYLTHLSNYYRIAINKYANSPQTGKIERNMIYDITAYIDGDGTDNESGSVAINNNCTITNWTSYEVVLKTINQHYLSINEYNIVMANVSTFVLKYVSDLPISITAVAATCTQYSSTGAATNVTYTSGQTQFPTFTINSTTSTITINSSIPINYVPKQITFTVTNNQGLSINVTVVQYSTRYVTARTSTGNVKPVWSQGGTNLNLFTVNTLVPSSNGSYTLGDPTNGLIKSDSSEIGNKLVSPRFIIASQYGIYNRVLYVEAQTRCYLYGEDIYRSGWRMPTKSEIELINTMQDDSNSAVKALLTGDAYWSAFKYDYYNFVNNTWNTNGAASTAFIRCVYDLYY